MAGLIDSYKKIYENKKAHIYLFIISLIWTILSTFWDIKTGNPNNYRQNPLDLLFNIIIGVYSLQFLHNALNDIDNKILPSFKDIKGKIFLAVIILNFVWGLYAALIMLLAVLSYLATHFIILPVIITVLLLFFAAFVYYIFLAYAEKLEIKGLLNIALLFKFVKPGFKPLYKKLILFILLCLLIAIIYILIYVVAGLTGIDKLGKITEDFYIFDIIMNTFAGYFVIVTWYFAFPYSLITSYNTYIKPIARKEKDNDTNA